MRRNGRVGFAALAAIVTQMKVAEREGFEPPCRLPGKTLSRRPRYDHFGTSPVVCPRGLKPTLYMLAQG